MSEFKGKNNFKKLSDQFIDKSTFFRDGHIIQGPEVVDFDFIERQMYGTIDLEGSSIYPSDDRIKSMNGTLSDSKTPKAFDFVIDMFVDVKRNIEMAYYLGQLNTVIPFLKTIEIKRSYEPPRRAYGTHLANIMINFNNYLEDTTGLINSITHFEHYVKEFMTYYQEKFQKHPITFSAWSQSNLNSLFSTGLAISIADIPFDNDDRKYEEFMNTDAFNFYKKVCLNRGFSVHQHIPYILVADLGSPAITKYIDINLNVLINTYYNKCYNIDYIILRKYIIDYYNILIERNEYYTKLRTCRTKTFKETIYRNPINFIDASSTYDDFYWINYYLDLRNIELGNLIGRSEMKKTKKYLKNLKNSLDNSAMISYIDSIFRKESFKKPYGFFDVLRRREEAKKQQDQQQGITGGSTIVGGGTSGGY